MHGWHTVLESRHVMVWVHVVLPLHPSLRQTHTRDRGRHNLGETSRRKAPVSAATMHSRPQTMSAMVGENSPGQHASPQPARITTLTTAHATTPTVASAVPRWRSHQLHARNNDDGDGSDNTTPSTHAHKGRQSRLRRAEDQLS